MYRHEIELCAWAAVALNSDASIRALKGPTRPVLAEPARLTLVAALKPVDAAFAFDRLLGQHHHAGFGADEQQAVIGEREAQGAQAVAV